MANGGNVTFHFLGDTSNLDKATDKVKNLGNSFQNVGKKMTKVGAAMTAVSAPMAMLAVQGINYNKQLETYSTNLTTLLGGSKEKADELLQDLKEMANTTPYETSGLISATQTMLGFGMSVDDAKKSLQAIGDIAMGDSQRMDSLTLAFSQVQSAGKLTGQDLLQMINAGFNPLNEISKMTGKSVSQLKEEMSKGAISAEMVSQAFQHATSEGGLFYQGMEKGASTTAGKISTLKDNFNELLGSLTENLLPILTKIVEKLTGLVKWFSKLSPGVKTAITVILGLSMVLGPLVTFIGTIITLVGYVTKAVGVLNVVLAANPIILIIMAIIAVIAILVLLYNKCEWFRTKVNEIFTTVMEVVNGIIAFVKKLWEEMQPVIEIIVNVIKAYIGFVVAYIKTYINIVLAIVKFLVNAVKTYINIVKTVILGIVSTVKTVKNKIKSFIDAIVGFFKEIPNKIKNVGMDIVKGIGNGITNGTQWIKDKIKSFVGNVTKFIKKVFKIGSPSRLMEDEVGQWIPKGIAVGINANTDAVQDAMQSMVDLTPSLTGNMSMNSSPNITVNVHNNMKQDPLGRVVNNIKTYSGGAKNDYNYGYGG